MKTSEIPSIRVEPELRREVEGALQDGESLSQERTLDGIRAGYH